MLKNRTPKQLALAATVALHAPLLLISLCFPQWTPPPPLQTIEVGIGLQQALEIALTKQEPSWELHVFGLPTPLSQEPPPAMTYSSHVLVDGATGQLIWAKPHPLFDAYLAHLRFPPLEGEKRLLSGYIATGPKQ